MPWDGCEEDSFFQFYAALLDLCESVPKRRAELRRYINPLHRTSDGYLVRNHDRFYSLGTNPEDSDPVFKLTDAFMHRVITWCRAHGKMRYRELLLLQLGQLPQGIEVSRLETHVYLYNPDNYPGTADIEDFIKRMQGGEDVSKNLVNLLCMEADGEYYFIPQTYLKENDLEPMEGRTVQDF